jgi:hypothetical protein
VTALGFKPKTPSSVVRYSIQLSYAARPAIKPKLFCYWTAKIEIYFIVPNSLRNFA